MTPRGICLVICCGNVGTVLTGLAIQPLAVLYVGLAVMISPDAVRKGYWIIAAPVVITSWFCAASVGLKSTNAIAALIIAVLPTTACVGFVIFAWIDPGLKIGELLTQLFYAFWELLLELPILIAAGPAITGMCVLALRQLHNMSAIVAGVIAVLMPISISLMLAHVAVEYLSP